MTRAIQELAGHREIGTTQRYMHLSPAAIEGAIRLLDERAAATVGVNFLLPWGADLDAMVPTCPEWTLRELAHHVGRIHHWAAANIEQPRETSSAL